jgi:hypothetical protein
MIEAWIHEDLTLCSTVKILLIYPKYLLRVIKENDMNDSRIMKKPFDLVC